MGGGLITYGHTFDLIRRWIRTPTVVPRKDKPDGGGFVGVSAKKQRGDRG